MFLHLTAAVLPFAQFASLLAAAQSDADFEAAVRAASARTSAPAAAGRQGRPATVAPSADASTRPYVRPRLSEAGRSRITKISLPPAGTIPTQFQGAPASRGELDPYAYIDQASGPMPLPPGGAAMRCRIWGDAATYTLGREAAPEVRRVYEGARQEEALGVEKSRAIMRGGEALPASDAMRALLLHKHAGERPENRMLLANLTDDLQARGYRARRQFLGDMTFTPVNAAVGRVAVKLTYYHSSYFEQMRCRENGMTIPTGPFLTAELYFPEPEQ